MKIFRLERKYFDIAFLEYNYLTKMKNRGYPIRPTFFLIFEPNYYFLLKLYTTFFYEKCSTLTATWQKFDLLYICRHNIISPWLREIPKNTRTYKLSHIKCYNVGQIGITWNILTLLGFSQIINWIIERNEIESNCCSKRGSKQSFFGTTLHENTKSNWSNIFLLNLNT